jgi:hypothetical protein
VPEGKNLPARRNMSSVEAGIDIGIPADKREEIVRGSVGGSQ